MTRILAADPGTINTGFSVCQISHVDNAPESWDIRFEDIGVICPGDREHLDRRRYVTGTLKAVAVAHKVRVVVVEEPPQTMYNQGDPVNTIIARAQSVFRVGSLASWILAQFDETHETISILPSQWQQRMRARAVKVLGPVVVKDMDSKQVSLEMANLLLGSKAHEYFQLVWRMKPRKSVNFPLETQKESNTADAINLMYNYYIAWQLAVMNGK